jgi:hypothetical protein
MIVRRRQSGVAGNTQCCLFKLLCVSVDILGRRKEGEGLDADKVGNAGKKGKPAINIQAAIRRRLFGESHPMPQLYRNGNAVEMS